MNACVFKLYRQTMAISIKEPCNEDWTKMTPTQKGAFCQACALDVVDFTNKTPLEIKFLLAEELSSDSRTCGRITNHQLDQINDEFFKWKSESESFRAIWLFSMVAVFGLTLFSCQNTHTKEMVNQLQLDTTQMLASLDTLGMTTVLDTNKTNDSLMTYGNWDVLIKNPWEEVYWQGTIAPDIGIYQPWLDCKNLQIYMVSLEMYGAIGIPDEEKEKFHEFASSTLSSPFLNVQETTPVSPLPPVSPILLKAPLEAVLSSGNKVFDSFIYPNPVIETSRVYIETQVFLDLQIALYRKGVESPIRTGQATLGVGRHQLDLKLHNFEKGEYQLKLENAMQVSILDFTKA